MPGRPAGGAGLTFAANTLAPVLSVRNLTKNFPVSAGLRAPDGIGARSEDVTFDIFPGETLGLVGESGCGKTTVGRLILRLEEPTAGDIAFEGANCRAASPAELKAMRRKVQVIFQDPYSLAQSAHDHRPDHRRTAARL